MFLSLLQVTIEEKLKSAPKENYQIGILIATYLPVLVLIILATLLYLNNKNRNKDQ